MLEVINIRVRSLDIRALSVVWEIKPTPDEVLDYRFRILRSESAGGPWDERTDWFTDRFVFLDNMVEPLDQHRTFHYLIRVKHAVSGETKDFGPVAEYDEPDLICQEIRRHWDVELHELFGRRCWLFPVRTFGSTCRNCYDQSTQRSNNPRCQSCYGTGFVRGYHHPVEVWIQTSPNPKKTTEVGPVLTKRVGTQLVTGAFPDIKPKDLIVEPDNKRWRVGEVNKTTRLGVTLHQALVVSECEPSDIEYEVPVNFDILRAESLAAPRNYRYRTTI